MRIPENGGLKIPHIGWNSLEFPHGGRLFQNLPLRDGETQPYVYFVHSYYLKARDESIVTASTEYGVRIHASVESGNIFACQFHPKKQYNRVADIEKFCRNLSSGGGFSMFTKRIIPCLDVKNGRVVKGINFVNLKDAGNPVEVAAAYDKAGADELVFLDITATSDARATVVEMVRQVAEKVFIPFTVGGGIRTVEDFKVLLREGADKISVNSAALNRPELISEAADKFGKAVCGDGD